MYHLKNFEILKFLRILEKYFQQMLEPSRGLYNIAWIIECMDDIERCTVRSFDPTPRGNSLECTRVYINFIRMESNFQNL
jgi:hypothetical protein